MTAIDLSCDLGEASSARERADEAELWSVVSSANVACGGHAGDPGSMTRAIESSMTHGVLLGAHPSYPDREGFGRRRLDVDPRALEDSVTRQIETLMELAAKLGAEVRHVKPHGALYNQAVHDEDLAALLVRVIARFDPSLALVAPPGSLPARLAVDAGHSVVLEGFADRAYTAEGDLVPRSDPRALLDDPAEAAAQAIGLARNRTVRTPDRGTIALECSTICIHGDMPGAPARARAIRAALESAGFRIGSENRRIDA